MAGELPNSVREPGAFHRFAERLVFGNRAVVLALFALVTVAVAFFASQLRVDAGFKKQIPLDHEYMRTFLDYEKEFGGANRIHRGDRQERRHVQPAVFPDDEHITRDVKTIDSVDEARACADLHAERALRGGGGRRFRRWQRDSRREFMPNVEGFEANAEQFATIKANIEKAGIVGRLVAKDFSGAMVWVDLVPGNPEQGARSTTTRLQQVGRSAVEIRERTPPSRVIGFAKMVGDISDGARAW